MIFLKTEFLFQLLIAVPVFSVVVYNILFLCFYSMSKYIIFNLPFYNEIRKNEIQSRSEYEPCARAHQNPFSFGRLGWPVVDISKPAFIALKYLFIIIENMTVDNKQFTQDHDEHILWCYEFILPAILYKNKNAEENGTKRTQTAK